MDVIGVEAAQVQYLGKGRRDRLKCPIASFVLCACPSILSRLVPIGWGQLVPSVWRQQRRERTATGRRVARALDCLAFVTFEIKQESFLFIIILVTEICSLGWTPGEVRRGSSAETLEHLSRVHTAGTGYIP